MVDIWLIFAQLVPFAEVLLHTWMDTLRGSEEREVNHHGTSVKVGETKNTEEKVFFPRVFLNFDLCNFMSSLTNF